MIDPYIDHHYYDLPIINAMDQAPSFEARDVPPFRAKRMDPIDGSHRQVPAGTPRQQRPLAGDDPPMAAGCHG